MGPVGRFPRGVVGERLVSEVDRLQVCYGFLHPDIVLIVFWFLAYLWISGLTVLGTYLLRSCRVQSTQYHTHSTAEVWILTRRLHEIR